MASHTSNELSTQQSGWFQSTYSATCGAIGYLWTTSEDEQALDPLAVIVELVLADYLGKGTKFSIKGNAMTPQPKDASQRAKRSIPGNRDLQCHLTNIGPAIERYAVWYRPDNPHPDHARYRELLRDAIPGLINVRDGYAAEKKKLGVELMDGYAIKCEDCLDSNSKEGSRIYNDKNVQHNVAVLRQHDPWTEEQRQLLWRLMDNLKASRGTVEEEPNIWAVHYFVSAKFARLRHVNAVERLVRQIPMRASSQPKMILSSTPARAPSIEERQDEEQEILALRELMGMQSPAPHRARTASLRSDGSLHDGSDEDYEILTDI
ncbi:MAG: hypothetical protein KDK78_05325 [Chlamydiia bacterium]|nr:hypothetical protein [Chlamydiia bacterium]